MQRRILTYLRSSLFLPPTTDALSVGVAVGTISLIARSYQGGRFLLWVVLIELLFKLQVSNYKPINYYSHILYRKQSNFIV